MFLADAIPVVNPTLPASPNPYTNAWDFSWLPDSLKTPDTLLIVASCWAFGYLCRCIPPGGTPATWRPLVVFVAGMLMSFALVHPLVRAFGMGAINVCLSMVLYDQVFSRIEDAVKARRTNPTP